MTTRSASRAGWRQAAAGDGQRRRVDRRRCAASSPHSVDLFGRHILITFQATIGPGLLPRSATASSATPPAEQAPCRARLGRVGCSVGGHVGSRALPPTATGSPRVSPHSSTSLARAAPTSGKARRRRGALIPRWRSPRSTAMRDADASHSPRVQQRAARPTERRGGHRRRHAASFVGLTRLQFDRALRSAHVFSQGRERSKTTVIRALHGVRLAQARAGPARPRARRSRGPGRPVARHRRRAR